MGGEDVVGVSVEVLAGSVVSHGGASVGVTGGYLDVTKIYSGVEHGRDEGVPQHVRMHPGQPDVRGNPEPAQPAGGGVTVHPRSMPIQENRSLLAAAKS